MSEPQPLPPDELTVHEAALMLCVADSRVREMVADGTLGEVGRFREFGHDQILVARADVERLAARASGAGNR